MSIYEILSKSNNIEHPLIIILGATATGKTKIAVELANKIDGEIISADSRQVFRGMDIGTGKDLTEYNINGKEIPYHLIDILDAGEEYNVFLFQKDFLKVYDDIIKRGKTPIVCGGTGLYIESITNGYKLQEVPINKELRDDLKNCSQSELNAILEKYKELHNNTDTEDRERTLRAIEISDYQKRHPEKEKLPDMNIIIFGTNYDRNIVRERITKRLKERLENGMIDEVRMLIEKGVNKNKLIGYGLEYRYITMFLENKISYDEMFRQLNTAIHQFAKRQSTWFRRMEKHGVVINWL